jgi:hypothetical protein
MSRKLTLGLTTIGLEGVFLAILGLGNLKTRAVEFILLALAGGILYLIAVYCVAGQTAPQPGLRFIFSAGLVFRATLFPLYPSLSDDLLRYRWEGRAQWAGVNPYRVAPADAEAAFLRDETYPAVNGKTFTTVYGPVTELTMAAAWGVARLAPTVAASVLLMKLPSLLFDAGAAWLLVLLLRRLGLPESRVLVYYWCPLTVVEFAASGHNDSLAVFFLVAALLAAEAARPQAALAALAASALAKLFAVFLAPLHLARELPRLAGRGLLWPALLVLAAYWPFRDGWHNVLPGVAAYSGHWRNNDSLFGVIYALTGSLARAADIYIAVVASVSLYLAGRRITLLRGSYLILGTVLLFAANCFPWYLTWLLPLHAVYLNPGWLLFTVTSALAYHVLIPYQALGLWQETTFYRVLEYAPVYALLATSWLRKARHEA